MVELLLLGVDSRPLRHRAVNTLYKRGKTIMNKVNSSLLEEWFSINTDCILETADAIFHHPELSLEEYESSEYLIDFLEKQGFHVERETAGLKTAFTASWGHGSPILGFLAEYEALPALGQEPVPYYCPTGTSGHGCGHNLLGTGAVSAACALKHAMQSEGLNGTIRVYGCPAEEIMYGKIIMNKKGIFDDLSAAITWHPFDRNRISNDIWLSQDVKHFKFYGTASHAARSPELGRSALDAAELMNVGVNYLREHVTSDVRMHYAYVSPPQASNIVPDYAETSYFIRSAKRARTDDVTSRVDNCAKGAALMTGTRVEIETKASCMEMKVNRTLAEHFYKAMEQISVPVYTDEELSFAARITEAAGLENNGTYFTGLEPLEPEPVILSIGTDVSDVSHTIPTVTISAAAMCKGTPLHHWAATAQAGMSIGYKGMLYAANCMALGALMLAKSPETLERAWDEHRKKQ